MHRECLEHGAAPELPTAANRPGEPTYGAPAFNAVVRSAQCGGHWTDSLVLDFDSSATRTKRDAAREAAAAAATAVLTPPRLNQRELLALLDAKWQADMLEAQLGLGFGSAHFPEEFARALS